MEKKDLLRLKKNTILLALATGTAFAGIGMVNTGNKNDNSVPTSQDISCESTTTEYECKSTEALESRMETDIMIYHYRVYKRIVNSDNTISNILVFNDYKTQYTIPYNVDGKYYEFLYSEKVKIKQR